MIGYVLAVNKEKEWTSHDAVQRLRCVLGVREIGHAGSLDPFATGVLLCGVGKGTKILSYLMDLLKDYAGWMRLGVVTDTGDRTGEVIERKAVGEIDLDLARQIAGGFLGRQEQIPPMVSALKHNGKRLYELARQGIEVERKPRPIEIHSFEILSRVDDLLEFRVLCGKGTYVRTLAQDFGEKLGPGACIETLCRLAVGPFEKEGAVSITGDPTSVREACERAAIPLKSALEHLPELSLRADWVRRIRHGAQPPWRAVEIDSLPEGKHFRLLGPERELVAIASVEPVPGLVDRPWNDAWELRLDRVL